MESLTDTNRLEAVSRELRAGEEILWMGAPDPYRVAWRVSPVPFVVGLTIVVFALFLWGHISPQNPEPVPVKVYGADGRLITDPMILSETMRATHYTAPQPPRDSSTLTFAFLIFLASGVFAMASPVLVTARAQNTVYAITDQRLIVINTLGNRVRSYTPNDLGLMERVDSEHGYGDIRLRGLMTIGYRRVPDYLASGLVCIPNVRQVEDLLLNLAKQLPC